MIVNPEWLKSKEKPYFHQISLDCIDKLVDCWGSLFTIRFLELPIFMSYNLKGGGKYKVENDFIEKLTATFSRFGKIAVDMGFITAEQLKETITEQVEDNLAGKSHRPTGKILLENGWITKEQIDIVLEELFKEHD